MSNEGRLHEAHIEQRDLLARLGAEHTALSDRERTALIERLTILRRMILALKTAERQDRPTSALAAVDPVKRLSRPSPAASMAEGERRLAQRGRDVESAEGFVSEFVATLRPNLAQICPEVRSRPDLVQRVIRSSLDLAVIHQHAAKYGCTNDEFIDLITIAYTTRLVTDCR